MEEAIKGRPTRGGPHGGAGRERSHARGHRRRGCPHDQSGPGRAGRPRRRRRHEARQKRRATPLTGDVAQGTAEPDVKRALYNIGDCALAHAGEDSWGIIGQSIRLHNSFWGLDDGEYSDARVVAYAGAHTFTAGNLSKHTYVVECEGHFYPATHDTVAAALTDASERRGRRASSNNIC